MKSPSTHLSYFTIELLMIAVLLLSFLIVNEHASFVQGAFTCFGLSSSDSKVCSGLGSCTATNTCTCNTGYAGVTCNKTLGIASQTTLLGNVLGGSYLENGVNNAYNIFEDGDDLYYIDGILYRYKFSTSHAIQGNVPGLSISQYYCVNRKGNKFCITTTPTLLTNNQNSNSISHTYAYTAYDYVHDWLYIYQDRVLKKLTNLDAFSSTYVTQIASNLPQNIGSFISTPKGEFYACTSTNIYKINSDGTYSTLFSSLSTVTNIMSNQYGVVYVLEKGTSSIKKIEGASLKVVATFPYTDLIGVYPSVTNNTFYLSRTSYLYRVTVDYKCVNSNYQGDNCDQPITYCYGIPFDDKSVCSGQGTCTSNNTCSCNVGYSGKSCSNVLCHGIGSDNSGVCSGRGKCIGYNNCQCESGNGTNCHLDTCFGILSNSSLVCGGQGYCTGTDLCTCFYGFAGPSCNLTVVTGARTYRVSSYSYGLPTNIPITSIGTDFVYVSSASVRTFSVQTKKITPICAYSSSDPVEYQQYNGSIYIRDNSNNLRVISQNKLSKLISSIVGASYLNGNNGYSTFTGQIQTFHVCASGIIFVESGTGKVFKLVVDTVTGAAHYYHIAGKGYTESSNSWAFSNGDGSPRSATLGYINSITSNSNGDIFLLDVTNHVIRQFNLFYGSISTTAGVPASKGYDGDNISAKSSRLSLTNNSTLLYDNGALMFYDAGNYLIRKVENGILKTFAGKAQTAGGATIGKDNTQTTLSITRLMKTSQGDIVFMDTTGVYMALNVSVKCNEGFFGDKCDMPLTCGGRSFFDPNVCSKHGSCLDIGVCNCDFGWSGDSCEISTCFNVKSSDASVCNGNGKCVGIDQCQCNTGYSGERCSIYSCYGIDRSNSSFVCSTHGMCVSPDKCQCALNTNDGYWIGNECGACKPPYIGQKCNQVPKTDTCSDAITCFGHGKCNSKGTCDCTGNFVGPNCNECRRGYYGYDCDVFCDNTLTCFGNGYCNSILGGVCTCNSNVTSGYYYGTNCNQCQSGYYGKKCSTQILGPPILSNFGNSVKLKITGDYKSQNVPCSRVFTDESRILGSSPKCYWATNGDFTIEFGDGYLVTPGESSISFRTDMLDSEMSSTPEYQTMKIGKPINPIKPVAKILKKKNKFSACDYLKLDGTASFSGDRRPLIFHWSLSASSNSAEFDNFNQTLSNVSDSMSVIQSASFPMGTHTISLVVESTLLGSFSEPDIYEITKIGQAFPTVSIIADSKKTRFGYYPYVASRSIEFPPCLPNDTALNVEWSIVESTGTKPVLKGYRDNVVISSFPDKGYNTYVLQVKASLKSDPTLFSIANQTIRIVPRELTVTGIVKKTTFTDATIQISYSDPEELLNPVKWSYSCVTDKGLSCGSEIDSFLSTNSELAEFTLAKSMFNQTLIRKSKFYLSYQIEKDLRIAKGQVVLNFAIDPERYLPSIITPYPSPARINPQENFVSSKIVKFPNNAYSQDKLKVGWYLDGEFISPSYYISYTPEEGKTYNFEFRAYYYDEAAYDVTTVVVNRAPSCSCIVSPSSGYALDTTFTMSCPNCQNQDQSLELEFGYIDYKTRNMVTLKKGDSSFQTALPAQIDPITKIDNPYATNQVFIRITDVSTGASTTKLFTVDLSNPFTSTLSGLSSLVDSWKRKQASFQEGDPGLLVFNSISISNAVKFILKIIDPTPSGQTRSLRIRSLECSGHGQLENGTCKCDTGYRTSDCRYSDSDFDAIRTMKEGLFEEFLLEQQSRNSTYQPITTDIMTLSILGIESFLSDVDYLTNTTFENSIILLSSLIDEGVSNIEFTLTQSLAQSCVSLLQTVYTSIFKTDDHNKIISECFRNINSIRLRTTIIGEKLTFSNITFTNSYSMKHVSSELSNSSITYSQSIPNLYVKLPDNLSEWYSDGYIYYSIGLFQNAETIVSSLSESNCTLVSSYAISFHINNQKLNISNDKQIRYHIPLSQAIEQSPIPSLKYSYVCISFNEDGENVNNSTCTTSFTGENGAIDCLCSEPTGVLVVKSVKSIPIESSIYCNGIVSTNSSVCNGNGNCTANEICQCVSNYNGTYCEKMILGKNEKSETNLTFICNGIESNESSVCNANGNCTSNEVCECNEQHYGKYCENEVSNNGTGMIYCNGIVSTNSSVCNGNGNCTANEICECNDNFDGTYCEKNITSDGNSSTISNTTLISNNTILNETEHETTNNSTVENNSTLSNNTYEDNNSTNSFDNSTLYDSTINNSTIDNSTLNNSTNENSTSISNSTTFDNKTILSNDSTSSNYTKPSMVLELIASKTQAGYCESITLTAIVKNNLKSVNYKWRTTSSSEYLQELTLTTTSEKLYIDNSLVGSITFNISVSISSEDSPVELSQSKQISIQKIQPIITIEESYSILIGLNVDVAPFVSLPGCYPYTNLVYNYSMDIVSTSVATLAPLVFDENGILSFGRDGTKLEKEGRYFLKFRVEGPNLIPVSNTISIYATIDPLVVQFDISSQISLTVGSSLTFQVETKDPNQIDISETLEIVCFNSTFGYCLDITMPITRSYSTILVHEGVYNFTAFYKKGSRLSTSSVIVTAQPETPPVDETRVSFVSKILFSDTQFVNKVNPNNDLKVTFQTSEQLTNPIFSWNVDNSLIDSSTSSIVIPKSMLLPNIQHVITLDIKDGSKFSKTSLNFNVNTPPTVGKLLLSPSEGSAIETTFALDCQDGWFDTDTPLTFKYLYLEEFSNSWIPLSERIEANKLISQLPPGYNNSRLIVKVIVYDSFGVFSSKESSVIVKKPTLITDTIISTLSSISSASMISTALNVIGSIENKTETIVNITNNIVSSYMNSFNKTKVNSENAISAISVYSFSATCLQFLEDFVTSNLISQLESFTDTISSKSFESLEEQYLDSLKTTTDKLYDKVLSKIGKRSLSNTDLRSLQNVYLNIAKAYTKSLSPDTQGKLISSTNSISIYSRKINTISVQSSMVTSEIVDSNNTILSLRSNIANADSLSSLSSFTILVKSENPPLASNVFSKVLTISIPEVSNDISSNSPLGSFSISHSSSHGNISCVCFKVGSNSFEKDESCCRLVSSPKRSLTTSQTSSTTIQFYKTGIFALRDNSVVIPTTSIEPIKSSTNPNTPSSNSTSNEPIIVIQEEITTNPFELISLIVPVIVVMVLIILVAVVYLRRRKYTGNYAQYLTQ